MCTNKIIIIIKGRAVRYMKRHAIAAPRLLTIRRPRCVRAPCDHSHGLVNIAAAQLQQLLLLLA